MEPGLALQFITGQPQKEAAIEAIAFPARPPRLSGARWRAGLY